MPSSGKLQEKFNNLKGLHETPDDPPYFSKNPDKWGHLEWKVLISRNYGLFRFTATVLWILITTLWPFLFPHTKEWLRHWNYFKKLSRIKGTFYCWSTAGDCPYVVYVEGTHKLISIREACWSWFHICLWPSIVNGREYPLSQVFIVKYKITQRKSIMVKKFNISYPSLSPPW